MTLNPSTVEDLAKALKEARAKNRQIVPIVGAGLSADCGFPVITAIVRYFGRLYEYIRYQGPFVETKDVHVTFLEEHFKVYRKEPWRFIEHFGWPDRFQLNQDLYTRLSNQQEPQPIEVAVRKGLDDLVPQINPQGLRAFNELRKYITQATSNLSKELAEEFEDRFKENWSKSTPFDVLGDWRRLILCFTNFQSDYADALFARFGATRRPGQGHQFLAFLVKHLAVPMIFTFNFDSLIEQALHAEGMRARIFAMERGAGLPHPRLIRDPVSVIKMHGSTHALLVDEQLDRPLTGEYLQRFDRLIGANPLLLVVGCSEGDRRVRDLVSHVVSASIQRRKRDRKRGTSPSVLWLHYEDDSPKFLDELPHKSQEKEKEVFVCRTNNPGATLLHLHSWLSNCHPAGRVPYLAHVQQPVNLGKNRLKEPPDKVPFELISSGFVENPMPTASHLLLETASYWALNGYHFIWIDLEAVHTFAGVVGSIIDQCRKFDPDLAPSVLPVNIEDIEGHSEYPEFVDRIIDLAARRVARALRRTRYYLAFDGLETYAWPATTHHGLTHMAIQRGAAARLRNLVQFLVKLKHPEAPRGSKPCVEGSDNQGDGIGDERDWLGESLIGVSVDDPKTRYAAREDQDNLGKYIPVETEYETLQNCYQARPSISSSYDFESAFSELTEDLPVTSLKSIPEGILRILKNESNCESTDLECRARLALVLLNASFFRRTRPLVAMRHLLEPLLRSASETEKSHIDKLLIQFSEPLGGCDYPLLRQLEGGGFWFNHTIRDRLYAQNTRYTNTEYLRNCLEDTESIEKRASHYRNAAFQLFLSAMTHQRIARTWYTRTFVQSQDTFAFLEYTYHQISSIRNLVKLRRLTQLANVLLSDDLEKGIAVAQALLKGIANCGELVSNMDPNPDLFRQLEFLGAEKFRDQFCGDPENDGASLRLRIQSLEDALEDRHKRELHGLYRAWTRAEVTLRTQVAAEQLLHWCNELLSDDLKFRCNRLVIGYLKSGDKGSTQFEPQYHKLPKGERGDEAYLIDRKLEDEVIEKFRRYLQDLRVKLWIERSDYETCINQRREQLRGVKNLTPDIEHEEAFIESCDVLQCHQLLDIVDSTLKSEQEASYNDDELIKGRKKALKILETIERRLLAIDKEMKDGINSGDPAADFPQAQADLNEAWLRLLHLRGECQLGRVSMFSHDGFTGDSDPKRWVPKVVDLEAARKTITEGLQQISERDARTRYAPRSVVVDPTADGALYVQYRSVFYLLNGRARWLDKRDSVDKAFEAALWSFEMARGGLGEHNPLMSALIELYTVEALLARSRAALFAGKKKSAMDLARGWYESARGGLQRAHESLLASRRNVIWRKFYFRLTTQYHSERLLLDYAIMEKEAHKLNFPAHPPGEDARREKNPAGLDFSPSLTRTERDSDEQAIDRQFWEERARSSLIRLRRGYQSLLTALDLYLPVAKESGTFPNRFRWLYRMWWELTLCGYATGRLALEALEPKPADEADWYVCKQLKWLNEMDGIEASELGKLIRFDSLNQEYEALRSKSYQPSTADSSGDEERRVPERTALLRRTYLIQQAMNHPS